MKKFIVCVSALVLTIFLAAVSAVVFLSFTVAALVVTVASGDNPKVPPDTDYELSAEITPYIGENPEPTDNETSNTTVFETSLFTTDITYQIKL